MRPMLTLVETEAYHFDAKSADRAVKFMEVHLKHFEDRWAGEPFLLLLWQKQLVRDVFGWKRKSDGLRRFREVFVEIAKGNGKSPLLSAIGMYCLVADGEQGAMVISSATGFGQANVTFDCAKKFIEQSHKLSRLCDPKQFQIDVPSTGSCWKILSGAPEGKAGTRPTCVLLDEAWEWPNRRMYDSLSRNARKRTQPLVIVATNAGSRKDQICWELHERAVRVLNGISKDDTLYPCIYAADEKDDWTDEKVWAKANPALDQIITAETLRQECAKAREVPALEAEFKRLHLSQWVQGTSKWLDMSQWDACSVAFPTSEIIDLPCFLGLDMSLNDDLSALVAVWMGKTKLYVRSKFWVPSQTAREYEDRDSIPFSQWSRDKQITLTDAPTIDAKVQARIARFVRTVIGKKYQVRAVCYDSYRATNVIALLEAAQEKPADKPITCIPVKQDWSLSAPSEELTRRLKEGTICIQPNPVMRWNAANAEARRDQKGNIHVVKEGRTGTYKGRRGQKIDGITALINAISQVRREQMQPAKKSVYESRGVFVV